MSETRHKYMIRFETENGKVVNAEMEAMGTTGEKAMKKLEAGAKGADHQLSLMAQTMLKRVIPALSVAALGRAVQQSVKDLASLDDMANQLHISVERLQELRFAGEGIGIDPAETDAAFGGFIQKVAEAQQGIGKLLPMLEYYGIAVRDNTGNTRDWEAILRDLSAVISGTSDTQEQMFIASRAGMEGFLEILRQGPGAIDNISKSAEEAGVVIREDIIAQAAAFDREWELAAKKFEVNFKQKILEIISTFALFKNAIGGAERDLTFLDGRIRALQRKHDESGALNRFFISGEIKGLQRERDEYIGSDAYRAESMKQQENDQMLLFQSHQRKKVMAPAGRFNETFDDYQRRLSDSNRLEAESIRLSEREQEKVKNVLDGLNHRMELLGKTAVEQEILNNLREAGTTIDTESGRAIAEQTKALSAQEKAMERIVTAADSMGEAWSRNTEKMIFDGMSLGDFVSQLADDMLRSLYRVTIGDPMSKAISGIAKNWLPSIFEDFGGFKASGGPIEQGKWYIAGEHGPEPIWGGGPGAFASGYGNTGTSAQVSFAQNVIVNNNSSQSRVETRRSGPQGRDLELVVSDIVGAALTKGRFDSVMNARYSLRPGTVRG